MQKACFLSLHQNAGGLLLGLSINWGQLFTVDSIWNIEETGDINTSLENSSKISPENFSSQKINFPKISFKNSPKRSLNKNWN